MTAFWPSPAAQLHLGNFCVFRLNLKTAKIQHGPRRSPTQLLTAQSPPSSTSTRFFFDVHHFEFRAIQVQPELSEIHPEQRGIKWVVVDAALNIKYQAQTIADAF